MSVSLPAIWWQLPGPMSFLADIAEGLQAGEVVLFHAPRHAPLDTERELRRFLDERTHFRLVDVVAQADRSPVLSICEALEPDSSPRTLLELLNIPMHDKTVIRIHGGENPGQAAFTNVMDAVIKPYLGYRKTGERGGFKLWVDVPIQCMEAGWVEERKIGKVRLAFWRGRVERSDMEAYVATLMASRDGPYGSGLLKSIVLEFSGFDRALAEELSRLKDEQLLALHEEWPERAAPAIGAADWLHGSADVMKNTIVVSARHLVGQVRGGRADAEGAKAILANLMWKAQLRSLFPWIEEIRPAILAPVEHLLQPIIATPGVLRERPGADPEPYTWDSLELGDALRLGGVYKIKWPRDSFNRMRRTKWVRDDLAHRRPASVASLDQMFGAVSDLI